MKRDVRELPQIGALMKGRVSMLHSTRITSDITNCGEKVAPSAQWLADE